LRSGSYDRPDAIGNEATPAEFLEHLWQATAEIKRVLKPTGSAFIMVARALGRIGIGTDLSHSYSRAGQWRAHHSGEWQQVIERTTGRRVRPLPKHDPAQERLL
jgi:hypothetical protein